MRFAILFFLSCCSTTAFADDRAYEEGCATLNGVQQRLSETNRVQGRYYWIDDEDSNSTYRRDFIIDRQIFYEKAPPSSEWTSSALQYDVSDGRPLRSKCRLTQVASVGEYGTETWDYVLYRPKLKMAFSCTIVIEKPSNLPLTRQCNRIEPTGGVKTVNIWKYRNDVSPPRIAGSPG